MLEFRGKRESERALLLAESTLSEYRRTGSVTKAFERAAVADEKLARISRRMKLSGSAGACDEHIGGRLSDLIGLVEIGTGTRSDMSRALELFAERLRSEIKARNRFAAKAGSSMTLTYMGMCFFFPLFSGISTIILTSSLGLTGSAAASMGRAFLFTSLTYVLVILSISHAFAHPNSSVADAAKSVLPYFTLASAVALATQSFLSGIL